MPPWLSNEPKIKTMPQWMSNGVPGIRSKRSCLPARPLNSLILRVPVYTTSMAASENSFDIVSKIDHQEVSNAIQMALKEIHTRFDLQDSKSNIELQKEEIVLTAADEFKLKAVNDVFQAKLVKRNVPLKGMTYGTIEP